MPRVMIVSSPAVMSYLTTTCLMQLTSSVIASSPLRVNLGNNEESSRIRQSPLAFTPAVIAIKSSATSRGTAHGNHLKYYSLGHFEQTGCLVARRMEEKTRNSLNETAHTDELIVASILDSVNHIDLELSNYNKGRQCGIRRPPRMPSLVEFLGGLPCAYKDSQDLPRPPSYRLTHDRSCASDDQLFE